MIRESLELTIGRPSLAALADAIELEALFARFQVDHPKSFAATSREHMACWYARLIENRKAGAS